MKKLKVLLLMALVVLLCACSSNKEALSIKKFSQIMQKEGFNIVSVKEHFSEYDYIKDVYLAVEKNNNYQIEFYELENAEYAISFYEVNKEIFKDSETDKNAHTNVDLIDSNRYTLITEDSYKVLSRKKNTVICVDVEKQYKDEIKTILKKLGY